MHIMENVFEKLPRLIRSRIEYPDAQRRDMLTNPGFAII